MRLPEMREKVKAELVHIPDWPFPQAQLRMAYWNERMASLGRKAKKANLVGATPHQIVARCIEVLQPFYPDHKFEYDPTFFKKAPR